MKRFIGIITLFAIKLSVMTLLSSSCGWEAAGQEYTRQWSADRGDGTYINPIINADFPDCDVIRVGDTYYFVGTTMYHFPGATLLKSKDLVNWEYCANPLLQIENNDAYNLLNGGSHYAQGMWASSLNYHNGKFYIYFISYGRNGYDNGRNILLTATDPEGEWKMEYWPEHYYDAGWLFDDGENGDGNVYVACGIGNIFVNKLNGKTLAKISSTQVVFNKDGYEGSRMYHIGDYYYIYVTTGGYWKGQTIYRSKNPMGPYEEVPYTLFQGDAVHQGALIQTQTGEWWTILFKDAGAIGRTPFLEPVQWKDGWPIIGNNGKDVSRNSAKYKKPNVGAEYPKTYLPTNDAFASNVLGKQWQWNHNPQPAAWSLTERPGWMRLYSCTVTDNLVWARGSLTQRIVGYSPNGTERDRWIANYGTAKFDLSGMQEGDIAGLAIVQNPYSFIGVKMENGKKHLISQRWKFDGQKPTLSEEKKGVELTSDIVYLRAITNFGTNACNYYYSYEPTSSYTKVGVSMTMGYTLDHFVGQRYYIFNYSTIATGGHIDVDWFSTEVKPTVDYFNELDKNQEVPEVEEAEEWYDFPFEKGKLNPSLIGSGTMNANTKYIKTAPSGMAGWRYPKAWDVSGYKYLVCNLARATATKAELRIYDSHNIWSEPFIVPFGKQKTISIPLDDMVTASGRRLDPSHICVVGISSDGSTYIYLSSIYLSDDGTTPSAIENIIPSVSGSKALYDLTGRKVQTPKKGIYILEGKKIIR